MNQNIHVYSLGFICGIFQVRERTWAFSLPSNMGRWRWLISRLGDILQVLCHVLVRDGWTYQNGCFFRKSSKWPLTPPLVFGKLHCRFFPEFMTKVPFIMAKICNIIFWIGNDPPPFWNFSENSSVLIGQPVPYGKLKGKNLQEPMSCTLWPKAE